MGHPLVTVLPSLVVCEECALVFVDTYGELAPEFCPHTRTLALALLQRQRENRVLSLALGTDNPLSSALLARLHAEVPLVCEAP
jgi:hypothetical protein